MKFKKILVLVLALSAITGLTQNIYTNYVVHSNWFSDQAGNKEYFINNILPTLVNHGYSEDQFYITNNIVYFRGDVIDESVIRGLISNAVIYTASVETNLINYSRITTNRFDILESNTNLWNSVTNKADSSDISNNYLQGIYSEDRNSFSPVTKDLVLNNSIKTSQVIIDDKVKVGDSEDNSELKFNGVRINVSDKSFTEYGSGNIITKSSDSTNEYLIVIPLNRTGYLALLDDIPTNNIQLVNGSGFAYSNSLKNVSYTGNAEDISIDVSTNSSLSGLNLNGAIVNFDEDLIRITNIISSMDYDITSIAKTNSDGSVIIPSIKQDDGKLSLDWSTDSVNLSKVAKTGDYSDLTNKPDYALKNETIIGKYSEYSSLDFYTSVFPHYTNKYMSVDFTWPISTLEISGESRSNGVPPTIGLSPSIGNKGSITFGGGSDPIYFPSNSANKYFATTINSDGMSDVDLSPYALNTNVVHATKSYKTYYIDSAAISVETNDNVIGIDSSLYQITMSSESDYSYMTYGFGYIESDFYDDGRRNKSKLNMPFDSYDKYFAVTTNSNGKSDIDLSSYITNVVVNDTKSEINNKTVNITLDTLVADKNNNVYSFKSTDDIDLYNTGIKGFNGGLVYNDEFYILYSSSSGQRYGGYTSVDGLNWVYTNRVIIPLDQAGYLNGVYAGFTRSYLNYPAKLYYSTNGIDWIDTLNNYSFDRLFIAGDKFYVSTGARSFYSTNGVDWESIDIIGVHSIIYNDGLYLSGLNNGIYYSNDGINWTQSGITSKIINSLIYDNGIYLAASDNDGIYYSTDGINWTQSNQISGRFRSLTYNNGKYVAGTASDGIYYSTNGMDWIQSDVTSGINISIGKYKNYFIAGMGVDSSHGNIVYSDDGSHWEILNSYDSMSIEVNEIGDNTFLRVYNDNLVTVINKLEKFPLSTEEYVNNHIPPTATVTTNTIDLINNTGLITADDLMKLFKIAMTTGIQFETNGPRYKLVSQDYIINNEGD